MSATVSSRRLGLLGLELTELGALVDRLGERRFHALQIYRWIYARRAISFDQMTDLPVALRRRLADHCSLDRPRVVSVQESADGTRKYLLHPAKGSTRGEDGVEAVFMPEPRRATLCISPQIGCALDCRFCLTAQLGLVRNLPAGDIVGQALALLEDNAGRIQGRPVNIVMMGMGEALHNYDQAVAAVRLLADARGVGIPARRITLSTAGMAPGIRRLAAEPVRPRLAVSLNATTDEVRSRIMPINRKYPLDHLLEACRAWPLGPRERLTFEYVLLGGVNDSPEDPRRLAALMRRHALRAKVNLIPFNPGGGLSFREPAPGVSERFRSALVALGVPASIRKNRGRDISAACGQLALVEADHAGGDGTPDPVAL